MAQRNRQAQIGTNFWLSNEEQVYLTRLLKNAKKRVPLSNPKPGDLIDEAGMLDDFAKFFDHEAPNGEYEII